MAYSTQEVAEKLGISFWTLRTWYLWESKELKNGNIDKPYLPQPKRDNTKKGRPKLWTDKDIKKLEKYKSSIVQGRNGAYGKYTNPLHKENKNGGKTNE